MTKVHKPITIRTLGDVIASPHLPKQIGAVDRLVHELFTRTWRDLDNRDALADKELRYPGVYLLAFDTRNLVGKRVKPEDVFYVGMSNLSVSARLGQFKRGLEGRPGHGAADHFRSRLKVRKFSALKTKKRFYFAALTIPCDAKKTTARASDHRHMGHVACLEYYAVAHVQDRTGARPELNNWKAVSFEL